MIDWIQETQREESDQKNVLSYEDFMQLFEEKPEVHIRTCANYLKDMLEHFGRDENNHFKLFTMDHCDSPPVFGQYFTQDAIYKNISNFQEEGINNKFILLVGPNGSAKSSFVKKIMKGIEVYSETNEGALYCFSWIFPIDNYLKGTLGLHNEGGHQGNLSTFAHLDDKEINAILPSDMSDNPLLLIPSKYRQEIIQDKLKENVEFLEKIKKTYLYKGDLSKRNKMVYEALLKNYKGDHSQVLKHIRVERFHISKRYSTGAVTIEPQIHVDAQLQQITMDKRLASLPPSLQSLNLFQMHGQITMSNRGILEFSDLLKRPPETYKYLLQTMESASINLNGILTELDIFFIGTSNEIHLSAFKQHPDYNSFKGRFNIVRAPYLLNVNDEEKIYHEQIKGLKEKSFFEPLSLKAICLFATLTRLRSPLAKNYDNKKLSTIIGKLNPLEKALYISDSRILPDNLDSEEKQIIEQFRKEITSEFENENLYEGKFGLSPRDIKNFIYDLSGQHSNVTFIDILDYLKKIIIKKAEFDFLNMTPQGDFHHPARFIDLINDFCLHTFDKILRDSLGMIDHRSYEEYMKKYIENVNAFIKKEKIKNEITGQFDVPDEFFIKEFEKNIDLKEDPASFRSHVISTLGAYYLDNPGKKINYLEVFPDLIKSLKESFRNEQKKFIQKIAKNIAFYEKSLDKNFTEQLPLSESDVEAITNVIDILHNEHGYSREGALTLLKFIIKERY